MSPLGEGAPGFKLKGLGSRLGDEELDSSLEAVEKELRVCERRREWKHESTGQGVTRLRAPNCPHPVTNCARLFKTKTPFPFQPPVKTLDGFKKLTFPSFYTASSIFIVREFSL